jgi:hypothetical protein
MLKHDEGETAVLRHEREERLEGLETSRRRTDSDDVKARHGLPAILGTSAYTATGF